MKNLQQILGAFPTRKTILSNNYCVTVRTLVVFSRSLDEHAMQICVTYLLVVPRYYSFLLSTSSLVSPPVRNARASFPVYGSSMAEKVQA